MSHVRRARLAAALVLGAAAGCGSSSDAGPATTAPPTTDAPVTTTPAPTSTVAPATTIPPTTTSTTVPPTTTTVVTTTTVPPPPLYLRAGDQGPEVGRIQDLLVTLGYLGPGYTPGVFDSATNRAVLDFQGAYGLIVDGVVGPETKRSLRAAAASVAPA